MSNTKRPSHFPQSPVSSRPGIGSSVRPGNVRDALTEAQAIAGGGLQRKASAPPVAVQQGKKTVMLVDDDVAARTRVKEALSGFYDVIEASDGLEAVEMCSIQAPTMIVSDVIMPRVDGFSLAKILRGNPAMKKVSIMFYSSRSSPQDVTQALALGACQYVVKTTPVSELVSKIRKILA